MSSTNTGRTGRGSRRPATEPTPTTNNPANTTTTTTTITNDILLHRLETGLAIAGGARGSLTRLLTTSSTSIVDWQLQQLEMTKLILLVQRQEQEIIEQQQLQQLQQQQEETTTTKSLDELRHELENLQHLQVCLDEYEAMSKLVYKQKQTSISEFELKQELDKLNCQIGQVKTDLRHVQTACHIRQSQFQLLQTSLQDFKDSLSHQQPLILEPHEIVAHEQDEAEMRMKEEENGELVIEEKTKKNVATHGQKQKDDDDDDDDVVMEDVVDADDERKDDDNANNNDGDNDDDDDGDLYGDL